MSIELATAYVQLVPSARGMQSAIAAQMGAPSQAAGAAAGSSFLGGFSKSTKRLAVGGVLVGALAGLGGQFDEARDTIRVGTGAIGDDLASLETDFRAVVSSVPTDFGNAGTAIADLNTRLGVTGPQLQGLSQQMLEVSRITGTDLGSNVESVTRFLGDAGVATDDYATSIDALFRASQATGPSLGRLADLSVQYGAPLRNFGFSFEQSAALLGKFEQEGVNTELVMGSLRIALGKFAKAGKDPVTSLQEQVEAIQNASTAAEANALAFETFGARAGADLAAAIREGRFEIGDLFDVVANGEETILGAAEDTKSLGEQFTLLKNKALVGLQPSATKLFDSLGNGLEALIPVVDTLVPLLTTVIDLFSLIPGPVLAAGATILTFAVVGSKFAKIASTVVTAVSGVSKAFTLLAANPWILLIIAAVALVFVIVRYWDEIVAAISTAWNWLLEQGRIVWDAIQVLFQIATDVVIGYLNLWLTPIRTILGLIEDLGPTVQSAFDVVQSVVGSAVDWIVGKLDELKSAVSSALGPLDDLLGKAGSLGGGIIGGASSLLGFDTGGTVPGRRGQPRIILAHGRETVLPTHRMPMVDALARVAQVEQARGLGSTPAGGMVHNDFRGLTVRDDSDLRAIVRAVNRSKRAAGEAVGPIGAEGLNW